MDTTKTGRTKELQYCACGCGREAHWHQLHLLRGPTNHSFFVLDECREAFEKELATWAKIKTMKDALKGTWFFSRWRYAKHWYLAQYLVAQRLQGSDAANLKARRDTILFVLPRWAARLYLLPNKATPATGNDTSV